MDKRLTVIALVCLVVLSAGCAQDDDLVGTTGQVTVSTPTSPPQGLSAGDIQRIGPGDAKKLVDSGAAILYDARSAQEYRAQHAVGALSFPKADLDELYSELPTDKDLIFY
jgi:hypothetical protein